MGCGASSEASERKKKQRTLKVVILGTASSGKSTFFKQMKLLNDVDFDDLERADFLKILRNNFKVGIKELIEGAEELGYDCSELDMDKKIGHFLEIAKLFGKDDLSDRTVRYGKALWKTDLFQEVWMERDKLSQFSITNLDYILEHIDRLSDDECEVTNDDIVRARHRTTGFNQFEFQVEKYYVKLVDVGGQKTERRKWAAMAQNPTSFVFFTSINEFDIMMPDSDDTTKLDESLEVWENLLNDEIFENASCLLFLNKKDLLKAKLKRVELSDTFENYRGKNDIKSASKFIKKLFLKRAEGSAHDPQNIYTHLTCAIDTNYMSKIYESFIAEMFAERLVKSGFEFL